MVQMRALTFLFFKPRKQSFIFCRYLVRDASFFLLTRYFMNRFLSMQSYFQFLLPSTLIIDLHDYRLNFLKHLKLLVASVILESMTQQQFHSEVGYFFEAINKEKGKKQLQNCKPLNSLKILVHIYNQNYFIIQMEPAFFQYQLSNSIKLAQIFCYQSLIVKPMQESQVREEQEQAFILPQRVSCNKHPSKLIDYFCKHPQCTDRLFCSSCLLKKQYCRHDMNPYIIDIAQFMYEQKMSFEMKGLSKEADIHDYLVNRDSRRKMYDDVVDAEIKKFEEELNQMTKSIMKTVQDLRASIIGQLEEFKSSYAQTEEMMTKKVEQAFKNSYMAQFESFDDVVASRDCSTMIGLRQLLEKLTLENTDPAKVKQIQKFYENLISMHDETPQIDYTRFQSIKSYFNVFQNKLSQAGPLLITLHKASNIIPTTKDLNPNAMLDTLSTVPVSGVKKYAKSASFPSNHSRTVYVVCKLPERKIITGSDDGSLNMFDMTTFQNIGSYQCHVGGVRCMISLPNSKLVTGSYDKTIKIWPDPLKLADLSQSNLQISQISQLSKKTNAIPPLSPLKTLTGHTSSVISLKYLNDGSTFASGSADYNIKIWDYEKGENIKNFSGHMSDILCMQCTSNGNTLISGSSDRTLKVWSLTKKYSSACLKTLTGHTDFIWTILLLQDDCTIFSGGLDKQIKMWDINTGNLIRNLPVEHTSHITKLLQLSKQIIISCANDGNIKFWDYKSNTCAHTMQLEVGLSTMMITNQQGIVAVGQDKNIFLCD